MLAILLLTYNRLEYAKITIQSTLENLKTSEPVHVHVADDGSGNGYIDEILSNIHKDVGVSTSDSGRMGYGANFNLAIKTLHMMPDLKYVLPLEDDWKLARELDIDPMLRALDDGIFGCIRMGYVGYTQKLVASFVPHGNYHWLAFDETSPEPHVFAGHPRIETPAWELSVGPWPEGLDPGFTEFQVTHMPNARKQVGWPIDLIKPSGDAFVHIGTIRSY